MAMEVMEAEAMGAKATVRKVTDPETIRISRMKVDDPCL